MNSFAPAIDAHLRTHRPISSSLTSRHILFIHSSRSSITAHHLHAPDVPQVVALLLPISQPKSLHPIVLIGAAVALVEVYRAVARDITERDDVPAEARRVLQCLDAIAGAGERSIATAVGGQTE